MFFNLVGAVMGSTDDTDSDLEGTVPPPQLHRPARRVSAPSILDTVCEDPFITRAVVHGSNMCGGGGSRRGSSSSNSSSVSRTSLSVSRKLPILPLSPQLLRARHNRRLPMWRSHSLEKLTTSGDGCQESLLLLKKGVSPSPKTKNFLSPLVRETQFGEVARDRSQRRGSASARKVMAIPEDTGILECPEISDSGRGSVDSGEANKSRANREISIDEGIGAECLKVSMDLLVLCG